jgi:SAM-dependent methyltransferase
MTTVMISAFHAWRRTAAMSATPASPGLDPADPVGARLPNTARIWNYHLGGKDNFLIDQQAAGAVNAMAGDIGAPSARDAAIEGRHLLQRMVDYMLARGVRQFLDLGSGFPNMANTHQIAHRVDPDARVVYVDLDPVVSIHATALMAAPNVITVTADLRQPEQVLGDQQVRELLDFNEPVGIMFICVLHCLWDEEDPWGVVRRFRDAVAPGSHLAISHMTNEAHPEAAERLFQISQELHFSTPLISRRRAEIMRFFEGFTLVEPGLVSPAQWRPDLHDPLRIAAEQGNEGEPVLQRGSLETPEDDPGVAWHLAGIGVKD